MRILKFKIWGDYGYFKKFYTTSSPLSYTIPPPTAVFGMIGALIGRDNYNNEFNQKGLRVAVELIKWPKRVTIGTNWMEMITPARNRESTPQINQEFLKDCSYYIYLTAEDNALLDEIKEHLVNHYSVYTLCLGSAQCIANFEFVEEFEGREPCTKDVYIVVNTVITGGEKVLPAKGAKTTIERMPITMKNNRQVIKYEDIVISEDRIAIGTVSKDIVLYNANAICWVN